MPIISIDAAGPFKMGSTMFYLVYCIDHFSKFLWMGKVPNKKPIHLFNFMFDRIFTKFGIPSESILSDNGMDVNSKLTNMMLQKLGVHRKFSSVYHAQGNAVNERSHGTINDIFKRVLATNKDQNINDLIKSTEFAYNNSIHSSTKPEPAWIMYGFHPNTAVFHHRLPDQKHPTAEEDRLHKRIETFQEVYKNLQNAQA